MSSNVETKMRDEENDDNFEIMGVFPMVNHGTDVNDIPSSKATVTKLDILFISFSILTHIVDVCFDLSLCLRYALEGNDLYFYWTMAFLFIPSLINLIISSRMYNQDAEVRISNPRVSPFLCVVILHAKCFSR